MHYDNEVTIIMESKSQNEGFARLAVSAFVAPMDPTVAELVDIKTAVSEAVTNAVIHGYESKEGKIHLICRVLGDEVTIEVKDFGRGIEDIDQAKTPLFTSKPEMERTGMGFTVMESFMDTVEVSSQKDMGTTITMTKKIARS